MTKVKCNACTDPANSPVTILSNANTPESKDICYPTAKLPKNCKSYYANVAAN